MKRTSLFRKILSVVFAAAIVFTVSVREVHYLFVQHAIQEHCQNHLHSGSYHDDCAICHFDVSAFTDSVFSTDNSPLPFTEDRFFDYCQFFNLQSSAFNLSLRGPPAMYV